MGNFSRDTFDPSKQYTGVRLQQGVPLVDADWNELQDVIRQELYDSLGTIWGAWDDAIFPGYEGESSFVVFGAGVNDLGIGGGTALVEGRVVSAYLAGTYASQPWIDPKAAAEAGIEPIPPMTTPRADRTDVVYLDVWDREVNSAEDPDIVNPVIGIETSVRLKREFCFRVAEGRRNPPAAPRGHRFMRIALLHRTAGSATVAEKEIEDVRRIIYGMPGDYSQNIPPLLMPHMSHNAWLHDVGSAFKPGTNEVYGLMPIMLPNRCRFLSLSVYGSTLNGLAAISVSIHRTTTDGSPGIELAGQTMSGSPFSRWISVPGTYQIVDTRAYQYYISAAGTGIGIGAAAFIYGFQVQYSI
jgi:uncharacterized protein DUF6519